MPARLLIAVAFLGGVVVAASSVSAQPLDRASRAEELRHRGDAYLASGDRGSAIGWYRDALQVDPGDALSYEALGAIYLDRGSLSDARAAFEAGVRRAPDHAPLWIGLAEVLERLGAPDQAASALRDMARRLPRDPRAHRARAEHAQRRGAWSEALSSYRRLLSLARAGVEIDPELEESARQNVVALRVLVGTLDPLRRGCDRRASAIRRALCR